MIVIKRTIKNVWVLSPEPRARPINISFKESVNLEFRKNKQCASLSLQMDTINRSIKNVLILSPEPRTRPINMSFNLIGRFLVRKRQKWNFVVKNICSLTYYKNHTSIFTRAEAEADKHETLVNGQFLVKNNVAMHFCVYVVENSYRWTYDKKLTIIVTRAEGEADKHVF